jgi:hypothetical protein
MTGLLALVRTPEAGKSSVFPQPVKATLDRAFGKLQWDFYLLLYRGADSSMTFYCAVVP